MIVMKFGGTSVEDAAAIRRLVSIVRREMSRCPLVVVSAMGKTTNRLLACAQLAAGGRREDAHKELAAIASYHFKAAKERASSNDLCALSASLELRFDELRSYLNEIVAAGNVTPPLSDAVAANGELLSSLLVADALRADGINSKWTDVRPMMRTSNAFTRARVEFETATPQLLAAFGPILADAVVPVTQGFIGSAAD